MATRRARWTRADGTEGTAHFDHGAPAFAAQHPAFMAAVADARRDGLVEFWPAAQEWVSAPEQPQWVKHLLQGATVWSQQTVNALERTSQGWRLGCAEAPPDQDLYFDAVVLAIPAIQAAPLLRPHHPRWAAEALAVQQIPLWTLMAAGDPCMAPVPGVVAPSEGPLAWVISHHDKPGRASHGPRWVAHARDDWSLAHLEDPAEAVQAVLLDALTTVLQAHRTDTARGVEAGLTASWDYVTVHRWRYAHVGHSPWSTEACLWDTALGLGLAGDAFGHPTLRETGVERAWRSGTALAECLLAA